MKRQNTETRNYFELGCTIESGRKLRISIPIKLYNEFENCISMRENMYILTTLYSEFSELNNKQQHDFQCLIGEFYDRINSFSDIIFLLRMTKRFQ